MFEKYRWPALIFFVGVLLALFVLTALGTRQQARAQRFLQYVEGIDHNTTFADVKLLADQYGGAVWKALPETSICTSDECYLRFSFQNPRNYIPLAAKVLFGTIIHVKDGRVSTIETWYEADSHSGKRAVYGVTIRFLPSSPPESRRYKWESPGYGVAKLKVDKRGTPWVFEVELNSLTTPEQKSQGYSFNLACLARMFGCTEPGSLQKRRPG